jgi:CRP/FNR family transcriptional regulator
MMTTLTQLARKLPAPQENSSLRTLFGGRLTETLDSNGILFWEGDVANDLFEIASGCLRLYKMMPDGRRAITGFMFPGEILGVAFKDRYLFTAEAVTPVRLRRFPRTQLHASLARAPGLSREVLAMACDELSAAQEQMLLLGRKTAVERIAYFLVTVARHIEAGGKPARAIDLPMSRTDIADFLGLTMETVSRVLGKLKVEGLISLPTSHHVTLNQLGQLQRLAGESGPLTPDAGERTVRGAVWPN